MKQKNGLALKQTQMNVSKPVLLTLVEARLSACILHLHKGCLDVQEVRQRATSNAALDVAMAQLALPGKSPSLRLKNRPSRYPSFLHIVLSSISSASYGA